MKFHISKFYSELQRTICVLKYGEWYYENEEFLKQFLSLGQGDLKIIEYFNQFSWLQDVCGLDDSEEDDLISFLSGLRPDMLEKMNDCKTIHEGYR